MSRQGSAQRRGAPITLLLAGIGILLIALATLRGGGESRSVIESANPAGTGVAVGAAGAAPSAARPSATAASGGGIAGALRPLPEGLEDRGWIAEIGVQRWLAGSLSGRILLLPGDEIALTATATRVVSVRYGSGGRTSTVRVRDLFGGRLRVSVDRPGTISSAVIAGGTVYVTGDAGAGGGADAGVQAISLDDGSVRDVIPSGPAPADATGPVTRAQLRLDPSGATLGSPLCSGDVCTVDLVNLASGARTTPVRNAHGFLVALADHVIYLVDDTATALDALDAATGDLRWHMDNIQLGGLLPAADGTRVLLSYLPGNRTGPLTFTLASADALTGALQVLLERPADADVPIFYPGLSDDRFAVIGGGTLAELLGGLRRRAALTLVDARSGATQVDAVTLTAP